MRAKWAGWLGALLMIGSSGVQAQAVKFVEVSAESGITFQHVSGSTKKNYTLETVGSGVAWLDFDRDGWLDLYLVNGGRWEDLAAGRRSVSNALYRNNGDGTFSDVTAQAGVAGTGWGMGATAVDFDNDGWVDLLVANYQRDDLYRNLGDGTFENVSEKAGLTEEGWSSMGAFADYDGDGWLDLYVARYIAFDYRKAPPPHCRYRDIEVHCGPKGMTPEADTLYRNNGDGTFSDVTKSAGMSVPPAFGLGAAWFDYDDDGDPDLFVANDSMANFLFQNNGKEGFEEVGLFSGMAYSADGNAQAGMGIAVGDTDLDGRLDFLITHFSDDYDTLYRNQEGNAFKDSSYAADLGFATWQDLAWGAIFFDPDNDGDPDLFVANGHIYPQVDDYQIGTSFRQRNRLFLNDGKGMFADSGTTWGKALGETFSSRAAAMADYDNDGDLDLAVMNMDSRISLLRNEGGNRTGNWFQLSLEGVRSNRSAIGARVVLETAGHRQTAELQAGSSYQSTHDPRIHFGLGAAKQIDRLTVRWPSGERQSFESLEPGRYSLKEGGELARQNQAEPAPHDSSGLEIEARTGRQRW